MQLEQNDMATARQYNPHEYDRFITKQDVHLAVDGIRSMREVLGNRIPTVSEVISFRPPHTLFVQTEYATDVHNPHNEGHNGQLCALGFPFIRLRQLQHPTYILRERDMAIALQLHDVRQERSENNPFHGPEIADIFENSPQLHVAMSRTERRVVEYLLFYHSDLSDPPETPMRSVCLEMLHTIQDIDASMLTRKTLRYPLSGHEIMFRTEEATEYNLLSIARLLEYVASVTPAPTLYDAGILAGVRLGLLIDSGISPKGGDYVT